DGKRIFGANNMWVRVWDAAMSQDTPILKGHTTAFSPDGKRIVSSGFLGGDYTVKVWDAATGQETRTLKGHTHEVLSLAFSLDGTRIVGGVSGSHDGIKVWDAATGQETLTLRGHRAHVKSVAVSPDGKRIVSGSYDHTVKVWD